MADIDLMYKTWKSWIGQRVCVKKNVFGTLKYFGEIKFKDGFWCGIELDEPAGETDGMINNMQYFKCKDNYGIFAPVSETTRLKSTSSEVNPVRDLIKLKYDGCREVLTSTDGLSSKFSQDRYSPKFEICDKIDKQMQSRNASDVNKTFHKNELKTIPDVFCFKVPKETLRTDYAVDKKYENVSKRSKNTCGRLENEESFGIISDLLDEEESWNLLDPTNRIISNKCLIQKSSDEIDTDSVFFPSAETSLLDSRLNFHTEQVDCSIQKCKFTSTPKRCLNNLLDLNTTVKLIAKQSSEFFQDEPIVACSSKLNFEMDLDLTKFNQSDILCSTLKFSLPSLPIQHSASDEIFSINIDEPAQSNKDAKYQQGPKLSEVISNGISTISDVCVNTKQFANICKECVAENSDILNTTFIINSDLQSNPVSNNSLIVKDCSPLTVPESDSFHLARNSNVMPMNSTFTTHNFSEKESEGEKTFVIDCSPIKIPKALPLECKTVTKKKTLSIIFETNSINVAVNGAVESEDEQTNTTTNESLISSKLPSEDMDQVTKSSLSKIAASDPNSTFCISSDESMNKKNIAYLNFKKRYSLSSISVKNVCIKKEKSVTTSLKANGQKSISQSRLSVITKKKSLQSSSSTNSKSLLKQLRDKNATEVSSAKKFLEMAPKRKLKQTYSTVVESSSDIAYARELLKKSLGPCKSVDNLDVKQENASHSVLKINENGSKVVERYKGVSNVPTKVIPKMPSNYKEITFDYSNCKVKEVTGSRQFNSKNPIDGKLGVFKHRHSMLPTVLTKSTLTKNSLSKDVNAVKSSFSFIQRQSFPPSKVHQDDFGRDTERKRMEKKCVPAEKVSENNIKYVKKNENSTILKSKLLKPGTLSRLPVPEKLSKKSGCILNTVDHHSEHSIKSVNKTDHQRIYKRLPFQKLQDKH